MKRLLLICAFLLAACDSAAPLVKVVPQADGVQTSQFSAPLGDTSEAQVRIRAPFEAVSVSALDSGGQLIDANVEHLSEMTFGGVDGVLTLSERNPDEVGTRDTPLQWTVGLSPDAALSLDLSTGSGSVSLDATGLKLSHLSLTVASGSMNVSLPQTDLSAEVRIESGQVSLDTTGGSLEMQQIEIASGRMDWTVSAGSVSAQHISIGSGTLHLDIPDRAALRLEVLDVGSGSINLEYSLLRIRGSSANEGMWETEGFANAEQKIEIVIDTIASGTFELE